MAKNLAELCSYSSVLWAVELGKIEAVHLAEDIQKQSVESVTWLLLTAYYRR